MNFRRRPRLAPAAARPATPKQIQLLHVLPAEIGWDDEERRGYLELLTGKSSAKELSRREATIVLDRLFEIVRGDKVATRRPDGATRAEFALAADLRNRLGEARFDGLARRLGRGQTDLALLSGRQVRAIIEATKSILTREPGTGNGEQERMRSAECGTQGQEAPPSTGGRTGPPALENPNRGLRIAD